MRSCSLGSAIKPDEPPLASRLSILWEEANGGPDLKSKQNIIKSLSHGYYILKQALHNTQHCGPQWHLR